MVHEVLKERMEVAGITQAKLADAIDCTPTQLGLFLKGDASLNRNSLDKCFIVLGVNLPMISRRIAFAKKVASILSDCTIGFVAKMSRSDMIAYTKLEEIGVLPEVTREEFELMVSSGIADYESTYPYFKALVLHFMKTGDKMTPKSIESSFNSLAKELIPLPFIPTIGVGTIIGSAVGALAIKRSSLSQVVNNLWAPLFTLAFNLSEKRKSNDIEHYHG